MVKILKAGFYSTIQDNGRFGYSSFGVPVSGAMDQKAYNFANTILGNDKNSAVIEMTMVGAEIQFMVPTLVAITGANMTPKLNGIPIDMNTSIVVRVNDVLSCGIAKNGFRTYIAVKGGFLTDLVLGSRSMLKVVTEPFKLNNGDSIAITESSKLQNIKNAKIRFNDGYLKTNCIKVTKGPEFYKLTHQQQESLLSQSFEVSKYNNRMAYQLLPLFNNNLESILTAPVLPGTVQLTPSGQLIVLMRDCQTTGGYPRVLQLTDHAVNILSQKMSGTQISIHLKI
ncbi:biotin-dependent carboxyltransferase family protein [uncultured Winogradskyella sp.]|uniref:5-oxoprolinase subunit C family protein n=1 Tax=uncultured Winogradskyella sp. TaxID=395353 RepID=UPI002617C23C|nr:biotin-dependent carboxyltransferase family protein [uncultured Winogradskyella sp.]